MSYNRKNKILRSLRLGSSRSTLSSWFTVDDFIGLRKSWLLLVSKLARNSGAWGLLRYHAGNTDRAVLKAIQPHEWLRYCEAVPWHRTQHLYSILEIFAEIGLVVAVISSLTQMRVRSQCKRRVQALVWQVRAVENYHCFNQWLHYYGCNNTTRSIKKYFSCKLNTANRWLLSEPVEALVRPCPLITAEYIAIGIVTRRSF